MNSNQKRWIILIIQVAVTAGALLLILLSIDLKSLLTILRSVNITRIIIALFMALGQFIVGAWRWQQLIYLANGRRVSWTLLFNSYVTSFFVSSIIPGTVTGDIVRIYDTREQAGGGARAASIVFMERLLGLIFLVVLGGLAWLSLVQRPGIVYQVPVLLLPAASLAAVITLAIWVIGRNRWVVVSKVQDWLRTLISSTLQLPGQLLRNPYIFLKVLVGTALFQILALFIVYQTLLAAHVSVTQGQFLAVAPLVTLALMLPISVQGIGVREGLYLYFLVPFGASSEAVLAGLSLTYLIGLPFSLWGWLLYTQKAKMAAQKLSLDGPLQ